MGRTPPIRDLVGKPWWLSNESYALWLLLVCAFLYSVMAAYIQLAVAQGISSMELVLMRALFQGFFVLLAMLWLPDDTLEEDRLTSSQLVQRPRLIQRPFGAARVRKVVVARGFLGGLGFLLYYYSVSVLPLGDATAFLSLRSIITVVVAAPSLGEPIRRAHVLAALASLLGCVLIAKPAFLSSSGTHSNNNDKNSQQQLQPEGYVTALLGACCGAAVFVLMRKAGKGGTHTLQLLFSWVFFGTLFSSAILCMEKDALRWPTSGVAWGNILGTCVFGSLAHLLLNHAGRCAPAGLASIMRSSGILWSYGLELVVFGQVPQATTVCGALLILVSLGIVAAEQHKKEIEEEEEAPAQGHGEQVPLFREESTLDVCYESNKSRIQ